MKYTKSMGSGSGVGWVVDWVLDFFFSFLFGVDSFILSCIVALDELELDEGVMAVWTRQGYHKTLGLDNGGSPGKGAARVGMGWRHAHDRDEYMHKATGQEKRRVEEFNHG